MRLSLVSLTNYKLTPTVRNDDETIENMLQKTKIIINTKTGQCVYSLHDQCRYAVNDRLQSLDNEDIF